MEQTPKILITEKADQCLDEMLKIANEGFDSGRIKKVQLASWILIQFQKKLFKKELKRIRVDHFDKIAHLKAIVKKMEEAKGSNSEIELERLLVPLKNNEKKERPPKKSMPKVEKDSTEKSG